MLIVTMLFSVPPNVFGRLDILVNNAGIGIFKPVDQLTPEEWGTTIQNQSFGSVLLLSRGHSHHVPPRGRTHFQHLQSA